MTAFIAIILIVFLGAAVLMLLSAIALYARIVRLMDAVRSSRFVMDEKLRERNEPSPGQGPGEERETEDDIRYAVRAYNAAVSNYNREVRSFPSSIIAVLFRFKEEKPSDHGE